MNKKEALSKFREEAQRVAKEQGIDYKVAMKAVSLARKRSMLLDAGIIAEANSLVTKKREDKINLRESELLHGKRLHVYSEYLMEKVLEEMKAVRELLEKK